jgi:photoactive yellow protein
MDQENGYLRFFQFNDQDVMQVIDKMNQAQLDDLPFGAVLLDANAKIARYNSTEGEITQRDPKAVVGKHFFLDLAACGVGPHFWGRFKQGIMKPSYDEVFPYVFYHEMPETAMLVRMVQSKITSQKAMWILVRRLMPKN